MRSQTNKHYFSVGSLIAAVALTFGAANALGADSLAVIPTLTGDTVNEGRAITSDGQYVVGLSGARGYLYQVGAVSSTYVLSSDNAGATIANGVGYRTSGGNTELVISGMSSGHVTEWMTADGGTSFGGRRRNTAFTYDTMGAANQLGSTTGSDAYYVTSGNASQTSLLYLNRGSGSWVATMTLSSKGITQPGAMNSVGASGRAAGWRGASYTARQNYMLTWNGTATPTATFFNGLAGNTFGEAFSVSADGNTIFGNSPITVGGTTFYGYRATFSGTTETSITALGRFGDETGSTTLQTPYGSTADGFFAVGMDYRGSEHAVLWAARSDNPYVLDLTDYATANGLLDGWSRLTRAYSVGETFVGDQEYAVITGIGSWSPDGGVTPYTTRAFVMTVMVPEPGTMTLLALGALLVFRRRK
jgi:PEP-CTERM motif